MRSLNRLIVVQLPLIVSFWLMICPIGLGREASDGDRADLARRILADSGCPVGLVLHLDCGDGELAANLAARDGYLVLGLDQNAQNVEQARRRVRSLGLFAVLRGRMP